MAVFCSSLNISITVFCLSTLVFFFGTRLYVPILLFFLRDDNPPEIAPAAMKKKGKFKGNPPKNTKQIVTFDNVTFLVSCYATGIRQPR